MNQLISFLILSFHLRNLNIEVNMLALEVLEPKRRGRIRNDEVNSIWFKNSIDLFNHLAY